MIPFVGVDGEGGDFPDESGFVHHQYTMLRAGGHYTTNNWLPFITDLPRGHCYVAYFFDYDATMILRELPEQLLAPVVAGQEIYYGPFRIKYRPRKELVVRAKGRRVEINDVGTFFQAKFLTTLQRWNIGTPAQWEKIGEGKEGRSSFGQLTAETVEYNRMECELLAELMTKFRRTCEVIGYLPHRWQGPGQLAKAMFRKHGIPLTDELPEPPPGVWEMAQRSYYGGRFETSAVGPIPGPVESWDINSAYPYACTLLPCLMHGRWVPTRSIAPLSMHYVEFEHARKRLWYTLPVRMSDGSIRYPRSGAGWYWSCELRSAELRGSSLKLRHGWEYLQECDHRPFDFMHRLYSIRKGVGKSEAGIALKLAMNSAYGICAQSVGKAPYANPVWAGLITAITRARLNAAMVERPDLVYMLATDGLFAAPGLEMDASDELGGWERTVYPNGMHIIQPGLYFTGHKEGCSEFGDCKCLPKTRGVPLSAITAHREELTASWHGHLNDGVDIPLRQFIGLRLAVARNAIHTAGEWMPTSKRITHDWSTKRRPATLRRTPFGDRTYPYDGDPHVPTVPYHRLIGGNLSRSDERLEFADIPDWAQTLTEVL